MENRRRYKRFSVDVMKISGRMLRSTEVTLLDITLSEATLKADMRLDIGSEYSLKLKDNSEVISLRGTVLWSTLYECKEGPDGDIIPQYKASLKLSDVSDDIISKLASFIEAQKEEAEHRLSVLKVDFGEAERVLLDFPEDYRVKKISLGGMLIGTVKEVEIGKRLPMEISLPGGGSPISFQARVASCLLIPEKDTERYDIGIEFINMVEKDRERLIEFIRSLESP